MKIKIGDKTKEYMKILEVTEYPFTISILQTNYKALLMKNHPDRGGSNEKTACIITAYKELKNLAIGTPQKIEKKKLKCKDIFSLFELCPICGGTGKRFVKSYRMVDKTQGKTRIKTCPDCLGKKVYYPPGEHELSPCKLCKGWGTIKLSKNLFNFFYRDYEEVIIEEVCYNCNGEGEYELDLNNPVIPKGAVLI